LSEDGGEDTRRRGRGVLAAHLPHANDRVPQGSPSEPPMLSPARESGLPEPRSRIEDPGVDAVFCGGDLVGYGPQRGLPANRARSVGDAYDNAMAESFVDSFRTELAADRVWRTRSRFELAVVRRLVPAASRRSRFRRASVRAGAASGLWPGLASPGSFLIRTRPRPSSPSVYCRLSRFGRLRPLARSTSDRLSVYFGQFHGSLALHHLGRETADDPTR
jgi:hypothetical protein